MEQFIQSCRRFFCLCIFPTLYCWPISEFKHSTLNYLLILNGNFNGHGNSSSSNGNSRKKINLDIEAVNSKRNIIEFSDIVNKNKHLHEWHECNAVDQPHICNFGHAPSFGTMVTAMHIQNTCRNYLHIVSSIISFIFFFIPNSFLSFTFRLFLFINFRSLWPFVLFIVVQKAGKLRYEKKNNQQEEA